MRVISEHYRGYIKEYLKDAMNNLGDATDYAVNYCDISINEFFSLFISSGIAYEFENGNPKFVAGMSGKELFFKIIENTGKEISIQEKEIDDYSLSRQYWCGWIIAYYQWFSGYSFKKIFNFITGEELEKLYPTLHEADEHKFVDVLNKIIKNRKKVSNLQYYRKLAKLSQSKLSLKAGVKTKTLQEYEIGGRSINKASVQTLVLLSKALNCQITDLLE